MKKLIEIKIIQEPYFLEFKTTERILFPGLLTAAVYDDGSEEIIIDPYLDYIDTDQPGDYECKIYYNKDCREIYTSFTYKVVEKLENYSNTKSLKLKTSILTVLKSSNFNSVIGCIGCNTNIASGCCTIGAGFNPCDSSQSLGCSCSSMEVTCCTSSSDCSSSSSYSCSCSSMDNCCTGSSSACSGVSSQYSCSCSSMEVTCCTSSSDCSSSSALSCSCSSNQTCYCTASGLSSCATCPTSGSYTSKDINVLVGGTDSEVNGYTEITNVKNVNYLGTSKTVGLNYYYSNNKKVTSSVATSIFNISYSGDSTINSATNDILKIDIMTLTESGYDKLTVEFMYEDTVLSTSTYSGNTSWTTCSYTIPSTYAGKDLRNFKIRCKYTKDDSNNYGADQAWLRKPAITHNGRDIYLTNKTDSGSYAFTKVVYLV